MPTAIVAGVLILALRSASHRHGSPRTKRGEATGAARQPRLIAEKRDAGGRPLDLIGVALLTLTLGVTIESLLSGRGAPAIMLVGLTVSAGIAAIFTLQQRRRKASIFDPSVLGRPA